MHTWASAAPGLGALDVIVARVLGWRERKKVEADEKTGRAVGVKRISYTETELLALVDAPEGASLQQS